jgi:hypothetical protein
MRSVAISPMSIIAVILLSASARAHERPDAPCRLGCCLFVLAYVAADAADAADTTASESVSWMKIAFGGGLLLLAARASAAEHGGTRSSQTRLTPSEHVARVEHATEWAKCDHHGD